MNIFEEFPDLPSSAKWAALRSRRDAALAETDYTQAETTPLAPITRMRWAIYRQALRDCMAAETPEDVVFPARPAEMADHLFTADDHPGEVWTAAGAEWVDEAAALVGEWLSAGGVITHMQTEDAMIAVLRAANVPPYHRVPTYTVITRLQDAGLLPAASAALEADLAAKWRFTSADSRGGIDADAADVRAFLAAIGADLETILAPAEG